VTDEEIKSIRIGSLIRHKVYDLTLICTSPMENLNIAFRSKTQVFTLNAWELRYKWDLVVQ
jgi:hypothetical protein